MEVKPGFKQTGAGVFPEDWEEQHLSSLVTTGPKNGYSGRSSKGARGTPTLSLGATTSGALVLNDDTVKRLEETIDPNSELFLQSGDVLVQRSNTLDLVGTTAVFEGPSGVYVYPDLMMRIRFHENATAHWFWRYANSANGRRFFMAVAAGSSGSMPKISGDRLRQMLVPVPPFFEQRAIATALNDVDALLGGLERLIAKKRDLKQAAMQQLLTGQTRLPGFDGEWETRRVGEIGTTYGGLTGKTKADFGVGHARYVTFLNVLEHVVVEAHQCEPVRVEPGEKQNPVRRRDILFNGTSETPDDLAMAAVAWKDVDNLFLNSFCFGFRLHNPNEHLPLFLAYYFRGSPGRQLMHALAQGATRYNMSKRQLMALALSLPQHDEQKAIATVLSDMDAEIAAFEARRDKTQDLKRAMMQELLTGKSRLVQPEAAHA